MTDAAVSLLVLAGCIGLFVWNKLSVGSVAILTALALYVTGQVDANTAVAGFGDPVVVFIATLFVVSEGLEASGVTAWAGHLLVKHAGTRRGPLLVASMTMGGVMAAFVTPNGSAAALLPVVVLAARRSKQAPAQLLMPLAFAASAGALLVLSGSTVNVIVSDALFDADGQRFGFFEFGIVGLPLLAATVGVSMLLGRRLLPDRQPEVVPADFSDHLSALVENYRLERGFFRTRVRPGSDLVGLTVAEVVVPPGVTVVGMQHGDGRPGQPEEAITSDDVLVVSGPSDAVAPLAGAHELEVVATPLTRHTREALLGREAGVAELVVPPRSSLVGQRVFPGVEHNGVTVLEVRRMGLPRGAQHTDLAEGDMLLVHGAWAAVESLTTSDNVLLVHDPELVRRSVPLGAAAWRALAVLGVTVLLLATGLATPALAGLVGALGMVLLRVIRPQQAYRAVSWQTVVLVGGLIPLSVAISSSGAADQIASYLVDLVAGHDPRFLLAALFVLTLVLGQVVSNTATVLIVTPIAVAAANESGVALAPVLMLVAVAGAASFLTPIATPANMIVMNPAGYRFGDYWKLGLATTVAWFVIAIGLIPIVWHT